MKHQLAFHLYVASLYLEMPRLFFPIFHIWVANSHLYASLCTYWDFPPEWTVCHNLYLCCFSLVCLNIHPLRYPISWDALSLEMPYACKMFPTVTFIWITVNPLILAILLFSDFCVYLFRQITRSPIIEAVNTHVWGCILTYDTTGIPLTSSAYRRPKTGQPRFQL